VSGNNPLRRRLLLAVLAVGLFVCVCWPMVWFFTCHSPVSDAENTARCSADANGHRMVGYLGTIVTEPDAVGGCEVRFEFSDLSADPPQRLVTVRLRRGWSLAGWEVLEMREDPFPRQ